MVSWTDLTPTVLYFTEVKYNADEFSGRSFRPVLAKTNPSGWDEMFAAHNFHELTLYYPMRVLRQNDMKLIFNIAWRLDYPFASDLWASSTWQSIHRSANPMFENRKVKDYLFRKELELYDFAGAPEELNNLAANPKYVTQLAKSKATQIKTKDPWQIVWGNESQVHGTGVGL